MLKTNISSYPSLEKIFHEIINEYLLNPYCVINPPFSTVGHFIFFDWLIESLQPKSLVELGTHYGNLYFEVCRIVKKNSLSTNCFAIDSWKGDSHAGFYGEEVYQNVTLKNNDYARFSKLIRNTFDAASQEFEDGCIDILHIDGNHEYENVKNDYLTWLPKVAIDGVIIFHDTQVFTNNYGVYKLVDEVKSKYPNVINFKSSYGLCVFDLGGKISANILNSYNSIDEFTNICDKFGSFFFSALNFYEVDSSEKKLRTELAKYHTSLVEANKENDRLRSEIGKYHLSLTENINHTKLLNKMILERDERNKELGEIIGNYITSIDDMNLELEKREFEIKYLRSEIGKYQAGLGKLNG